MDNLGSSASTDSSFSLIGGSHEAFANDRCGVVGSLVWRGGGAPAVSAAGRAAWIFVEQGARRKCLADGYW
jgi:hypothetical protein